MLDPRPRLPQLEDRVFITDSGLETTLIFREDIDLPLFAAFPLLENANGRRRLRNYFQAHLSLAQRAGAGFIAESPTWRASSDWASKLGYDANRLEGLNWAAISMLTDLRHRNGVSREAFVISGVLGPRSDGYGPAEQMSAAEAESYHGEQISTFADTPVDLVSALTLTYPAEAIGITRAAQLRGIPVVISFTVETDGRLPSGISVGDAIREVDAATYYGPSYYMLNCAHPSHFASVLETQESWVWRIRGIRANASRCSHAELDDATELDDGDPEELGRAYADLIVESPQLTILGGCCGTDARHIAAITRHCQLPHAHLTRKAIDSAMAELDDAT
jgi:S-methylmethionine-dependent homocysteine/selenocysteine methylase